MQAVNCKDLWKEIPAFHIGFSIVSSEFNQIYCIPDFLDLSYESC